MRRLLRALGLLGAGLIALVLVGWLGLRLWALHVVRTAVPEFEAKHGSLDRSQWHREMPPPSENGGQYLRAAGLLADGSGAEWERWYEAVATAHGEPTDERARADFAVVVERNRRALELLREGAAKNGCVVFGDLPVPGVDLAFLTGLFRLARIDRQLAFDELARGEEAAAAVRLAELLRVADCIQRDPVLVVYLWGSALERMILRDLRSPLAAGRLDGSLPTLAPYLKHDGYPPVTDRIRAEAATFRPGAWWRGTGWNRPDRMDTPGNPIDVEGFMGAMTVRVLGETLDSLDQPAPPPLQGESGWSLRPFERILQNVHRNYWTYERTARAQAAVRALARATVAVRERGLAEGRYPTSLDELGAGLGEPTPLAGEAIRYEVAADGSARLSLPASAKEWQRIAGLLELDAPGKSNFPGRFDFEWTLPPLPAGGAGAPSRD